MSLAQLKGVVRFGLAALTTLVTFQEKLTNLRHFWTRYENVEHLKRQFRDQLDNLQREGKLAPRS